MGSQGSFLSTTSWATTEGGAGEGKGKEEVLQAKLQTSLDTKEGQFRRLNRNVRDQTFRDHAFQNYSHTISGC